MYRIEIEPTETGFSAFSPDVPGVGVTARSREEVEQLLREAIAFHLEPNYQIMYDSYWRAAITAAPAQVVTPGSANTLQNRNHIMHSLVVANVNGSGSVRTDDSHVFMWPQPPNTAALTQRIVPPERLAETA